MKKRNSFHEDKYLFSRQKIFLFMKIIRKKAELGYNNLLITLMSHDVKHHIVGVAHRFLPYAC